MMRTVVEDEIYDLKMERLDKEYFLEHIYSRHVGLFKHVKHVDTQLREDNDRLHWRVQGYISYDDVKSYRGEYGEIAEINGCLRFNEKYIELWSVELQFKN